MRENFSFFDKNFVKATFLQFKGVTKELISREKKIGEREFHVFPAVHSFGKGTIKRDYA